MSPITHRQIRRWLYNPIYDAKVKVKPAPIRHKFFSFLFHSHKDEKNASNHDKIHYENIIPEKITNLREDFERKKN